MVASTFKQRFAGFLLPVVLAAPALGESSKQLEADKRIYIAPSALWTFIDEDTALNDDAGYRIAIGKPLTKHLNLEIEAYKTDADYKDSRQVDGGIEGIGLNVLFFPARYHSPFFMLLGASAGEYTRDASTAPTGGAVVDEFDFGGSIEAGFGFLHPLTNAGGVVLRSEYRFRMTALDDEPDEIHDHSVSLGLQIALGSRRSDQLTRSSDWRNPDSAPAAPQPQPAPVAADTDADGVPNTRDECPTTRRGARVMDNGCTLTAARPLLLEGVQFEFAKAVLRPESREILEKATAVLKQQPNVSVEVGGHTDRIGSVEKNMVLSEARANTVRNYLIRQGISPKRLTARGYGPHYPIAANTKNDGSDNPEGRAKNRRVVLKVIR